MKCRKKQKQAAACEAGNPHSQDAAKKRQRAVVVADWLIATFGRYLQQQLSHSV